jgi:hypothetical protein
MNYNFVKVQFCEVLLYINVTCFDFLGLNRKMDPVKNRCLSYCCVWFRPTFEEVDVGAVDVKDEEISVKAPISIACCYSSVGTEDEDCGASVYRSGGTSGVKLPESRECRQFQQCCDSQKGVTFKETAV